MTLTQSMPVKTSIPFFKMHGLGNDFVIVNALQQPFDIKDFPITQLSDRHVGIGFDQLLVIERSNHADFFCQIWNADGSPSEQCGNGLRCVARLVVEENLYGGKQFRIATKAGVFPVSVENFDHITVRFNAPEIENKLANLTFDNEQSISISILSLGNPHAILRVESAELAPVQILGPKISMHQIFPLGTNVGFMEIVNDEHIRLRTFERGSGETLACGSNAAASVCVGIANGWLNDKVRVEYQYGSLWIEQQANGEVLMTGPASRVFDGVIRI